MTLRHLEIFSAVCAQESFTRAAEQLNMAQPAVSLAIRELEVFYNVRLFERMNRRVYLTEAGRTLRQYADTVLSQFQESVEILRESGTQGACRFGVHVTLGETRLAGILAHLAEALPEITVRASIHNSRETERMILQNELDFAVVDNVTVSPHYLVEPLCGEELAAVCAPGYLEGKNSLTLAELEIQDTVGTMGDCLQGSSQMHSRFFQLIDRLPVGCRRTGFHQKERCFFDTPHKVVLQGSIHCCGIVVFFMPAWVIIPGSDIHNILKLFIVKSVVVVHQIGGCRKI